MILLDKPFVSDFLIETTIRYQFTVVKTPQLNELGLKGDINYITEAQAIEKLKKEPTTRIYSNSENAITWIANNLNFTDIPDQINLFKDKYLFREQIRSLFPEFYYNQFSFDELDAIDTKQIPKPFIIKPSVGFFSMAVYKVQEDDEWPEVVKNIKQELKQVAHIYPKEVMDTTRFIVEEIITGDEYAIDAYYDDKGEPCVLNIMKHIFAHKDDFSDRLYMTSANIILEYANEMECFLRDIGMFSNLKNFPVHVEVRINENGKIIPIEVNPMRFGAWCTTADATWFAYQFNSIEYYFANKRPEWGTILRDKTQKNYAMFVLENSTGYEASRIKSFDKQKILSNFKNPIEFREIDFNKYPVFGFLFVESTENDFGELEKLLKSNLTEYIELYN